VIIGNGKSDQLLKGQFAVAIATPACNDGGARERVPPASDTLFGREGSSRMAETPCGSVYESPLPRQLYAQEKRI
jgi:hypothetical protein